MSTNQISAVVYHIYSNNLHTLTLAEEIRMKKFFALLLQKVDIK